jgi:hypothetical protein
MKTSIPAMSVCTQRNICLLQLSCLLLLAHLFRADLCSFLQQAVAEDAWPFMKTSIPPLWQHPVGPAAAPFAVALTTMFYGPSIGTKLAGLAGVLKAVTGMGAASSSSSSKPGKTKAC